MKVMDFHLQISPFIISVLSIRWNIAMYAGSTVLDSYMFGDWSAS